MAVFKKGTKVRRLPEYMGFGNWSLGDKILTVSKALREDFDGVGLYLEEEEPERYRFSKYFEIVPPVVYTPKKVGQRVLTEAVITSVSGDGNMTLSAINDDILEILSEPDPLKEGDWVQHGDGYSIKIFKIIDEKYVLYEKSRSPRGFVMKHKRPILSLVDLDAFKKV